MKMSGEPETLITTATRRPDGEYTPRYWGAPESRSPRMRSRACPIAENESNSLLDSMVRKAVCASFHTSSVSADGSRPDLDRIRPSWIRKVRAGPCSAVRITITKSLLRSRLRNVALIRMWCVALRLWTLATTASLCSKICAAHRQPPG